jgi:hypothetical protein
MQGWIVRQRDAHAWVEVYDDLGQRWVGFDATPTSRQQRLSRTGLMGFLEQSRAWIDLQVHLAAKRLYRIDYMAWFQQRWQPRRWLWPLAIHGLVLTGLIAVTWWLWRRVYRWLHRWWQQRRWPVGQRRVALDAAQEKAQASFLRLATILQQRGIPILQTETLEEYVERLSTRDLPTSTGPVWSSPPSSRPSRCATGEEVPLAFFDLLMDFSQAYHQIRFRPGPDASSDRPQSSLQERLTFIRQTTDQLQQLQRDRTIR